LSQHRGEPKGFFTRKGGGKSKKIGTAKSGQMKASWGGVGKGGQRKMRGGRKEL